MMILKYNKHSLLASLAMMFLLVCSPESLIVGTNSSPFFWTVYKVSIIFTFCVLALWVIIRKKTGGLQYVCPLIAVIWLNYILTNSNNSFDTYIQITLVILSAWMIAIIFKPADYLSVFERTVFLLAFFSLIVFIVSVIAPNIIRQFPVITNISGARYYNLGLSVVSERALNNSVFQIRNTGVFREPGVFQFFLNIAFCVYIFRDGKIKLFRIVVYVLTLLTTASTTGLIAMLVIFIVYVKTKSSKRKKSVITIMIILTVLLAVLSTYVETLNYAFNKLGDSQNYSTIARLYSVVDNMKIWFRYPIIGSGMYNNELLFPELVYQDTAARLGDNTNTYMYLLSCFGPIAFTTMIVGLYQFSKKTWTSNTLLYMLMFLIVLAGENFVYSSFVYTFMFFGLCHQEHILCAPKQNSVLMTAIKKSD